MKKHLVRFVLCLSLFVMCVIGPLPAIAQTQSPQLVVPVYLHRFRRSNENLGYLLTTDYSEGVNAGFAYEFAITFNGGGWAGVYRPPAAGWTPDPYFGLVPLHRYLVVQGSRVYYHYTTYLGGVGSNYYYEGIIGYVFPPGRTTQFFPASGFTYNLQQLSTWYSQSYGYWPGSGGVGYGYFEQPPNVTFFNHGVIAALPPAFFGTSPQCPQQPCGSSGATGNSVLFYAPAPPPEPPTCDPEVEENCYYWDGNWDSSNCSCTFY